MAALALSMFDGWHGLHGLGKQYKKLLKTAALLHDIGITINYYSHARHSSYMILNAKIFGLTHAEQMLCAVIAGWHNGIAKRYFKKSRLPLPAAGKGLGYRRQTGIASRAGGKP